MIAWTTQTESDHTAHKAMIRPATSTTHNSSNMHPLEVFATSDDIVQHVPVFWAWMLPCRFVFVSLLKVCTVCIVVKWYQCTLWHCTEASVAWSSCEVYIASTVLHTYVCVCVYVCTEATVASWVWRCTEEAAESGTACRWRGWQHARCHDTTFVVFLQLAARLTATGLQLLLFNDFSSLRISVWVCVGVWV